MSLSEGKDAALPGSRLHFGALLRSFRDGSLTVSELLLRTELLLDAGASPAECLAILRDQPVAPPLTREVHDSVAFKIAGSLKNKYGGGVPLSDDPPTTILAEPDTATDADPNAVSARPQQQRSPLKTGDILQARFRLVELIGSGGLSRVFKALDLRRVEAGSRDPFIAVKILSLPFNDYFGSIAALQSEAQKLQNLSHPNIVRVFDCDRDGENVFMTMELLDGARLPAPSSERAAPPIDPARAQAIIFEIGGALDYAHRNHIVHGDLKPGNVIVTDRGEVKVIDFGIAKWITQAESGGPEGQAADRNQLAWAATARYASPQVMARQMPQPSDDVYALACLAYLLLTGSHPLDQEDDSAPAGPLPRRPLPRRPLPRRPGMTDAQYAAITEGLRSERSERTASVNEFLAAFTAAPSDSEPVQPSRWLWWVGAATLLLLAWAYRYSSHGWLHRPGIAPAPRPIGSTRPPIMPGSVIRDCANCPVATVLPPGHFLQGSAEPQASSFEVPQHSVTIAQPLGMAPVPVTVANFQEFATATARPMEGCDVYDGNWNRKADADWAHPGFAQGPSNPAVCVSWSDAVEYAKWLSVRTGHHYRLPSASEYEYAARAGGAAPIPWVLGEQAACEFANVADRTAAYRYAGWKTFPCTDGYEYTAPVASFRANAFGLNDMLGNVFEWTQDCWSADYAGAPADGSARTDGDCAEHELRGGSWFSSPASVSATYRSHFGADYRATSVGFRLVREMSP